MMAILPLYSTILQPFIGSGMFHPNFNRERSVKAAKHPITTTTFIVTITTFFLPAASGRTDSHCPPQQRRMPRRTNVLSQPYISPTQCTVAERVSPVALAQFQRQLREHNIPYWGQNCVIGVLNLVDGELGVSIYVVLRYLDLTSTPILSCLP
jgi:hypothetical protein